MMGWTANSRSTGLGVDAEVRQPVEISGLFGGEDGADFLPNTLILSHDLFAEGVAKFAHAIVTCLADLMQLLLLLISQFEVIDEITVRPKH